MFVHVANWLPLGHWILAARHDDDDDEIYNVFHNCWNKAAASQIFSIDFILFLISDYCWKIVNILIYSTKYGKMMPWTME